MDHFLILDQVVYRKSGHIMYLIYLKSTFS